jgi:energy-coupling factor transporter transmembrane protein EcfT
VNTKLSPLHPNRVSYLKHKRETNLQILLPILLSSLLMVGLFALISYSTFAQNGDVARWAAISTIWIVIPLMLLLLVILALLGGMVYGMQKLLKITPDYSGLAQQYALMITAKTQEYAAEISSRVIRFRAWTDTIQAFFKRN